MAQFNVNIAINQNDVATLKNQGFKLFAFKAVGTSIQGGAPLVWFETQSYLANTTVKWEESYRAYIAQGTQIDPTTEIVASNSADIDLGQTMTISTTGVLDVKKEGPENHISVIASQGQSWTTGLSQFVDGIAKPLCAVPILSGFLDRFTPIEKVLFMFATAPYTAGTVIVQAFSPGILVDLTGTSNRSITYNIQDGWGPTTETWADNIPVNSSLTPLLIYNV